MLAVGHHAADPPLSGRVRAEVRVRLRPGGVQRARQNASRQLRTAAEAWRAGAARTEELGRPRFRRASIPFMSSVSAVRPVPASSDAVAGRCCTARGAGRAVPMLTSSSSLTEYGAYILARPAGERACCSRTSVVPVPIFFTSHRFVRTCRADAVNGEQRGREPSSQDRSQCHARNKRGENGGG
jgi:hypothetical protein